MSKRLVSKYSSLRNPVSITSTKYDHTEIIPRIRFTDFKMYLIKKSLKSTYYWNREERGFWKVEREKIGEIKAYLKQVKEYRFWNLRIEKCGSWAQDGQILRIIYLVI